ncbi:c-type cytochrome [Deinococcus koreensis]|uniref:Cytochrome c domain-containing protein n=1 Tax=Deinococcus koreensis TaxID=2054903 RepID=A0A2K3V108_9DEIO|nr:cytochrome c [Deinococcus koreensis]PNY82467.1 hypothetical protein CVO96_14915 [Deinococcus koreensis]
MRTLTNNALAGGLLGVGLGGVFLVALATPATSAAADPLATQVKSGAAVYAKSCQGCHGDKLQGVRGPALLGAGLLAKYAGGTHTLADLHTKVSKTMPKNAPASLKPQQYLDVVAFLFDRNGVALPKTGLTRASLTQPAVKAAAATPRATQVQAGAAVFASSCQGCHGATLQGGRAPELLGTDFISKWTTAGELHGLVSKAMPMNAPGTLSEQQYLDVVAFLLDRNKVAGGPAALSAKDLATPLK